MAKIEGKDKIVKYLDENKFKIKKKKVRIYTSEDEYFVGEFERLLKDRGAYSISLKKVRHRMKTGKKFGTLMKFEEHNIPIRDSSGFKAVLEV